ncbi:MBL fold metallo-hydrolase [Conexibacter sp. CPCC 206217]|uniref:MBL fold metallo-hydrolase n=1 Tax=Conexibacter sp. CPCC 206217 TaxID=3064574 RepID=UPI00272868F1|nr:MBL fold metallo-hydrolase [Conexibacter sp. CPCC 206217]MDO8209090.1 MBL fold metallo-hydrolase [Conexibacter sp. CPCC 206217]
MPTGTIHEIAPDLYLIEGHHPHNLWDDPDLPTLAVYRSGRRLYLLDTGVGPEQREAIRELANRYAGEVDEVLLLNSHGHLDHLGNNDVLAEIAPGATKRHHLPRASRSALEFESFFGAMYKRGLPYFDYLSGLTLPPDGVASLLRALGADDALTGADVADLGARIAQLGIGPAVSGFLPSLVVDILLQTYPPVFPSVETIVDYERIAPAADIRIGDSAWTGWTFAGDDGRPEVQVLESGGHSFGGVVFYLPEHRFMFMADETTSVPIWADTDPRRTIATAHKALAMIDGGQLELLCAGHRPLLPVSGAEARAALEGVIASGTEFAAVVGEVLARHPDGIGIDALYDTLLAEAQPGSTIAILAGLQFPVFSTFLKLTLLNHCLLLDLPQGTDASNRPTFKPV